MKNNNRYWTWRRGRELIQFDSEETMKNYRPDEHSWWGKNGSGQLYAFLSPRLPNVDLIKGTMKNNIEYSVEPFDRFVLKVNTDRNTFNQLVNKLHVLEAQSENTLNLDVGYSDMMISVGNNSEEARSEVMNFLKKLNVPFEISMNEGVGWGDPNKPDKKKAFKGAHWTVKYEESKNMKIKKSELREVIKELVTEMWADTNPVAGIDSEEGGDGGEEGGVKPTGRLTAAGADRPFVDLYKGEKGTVSTLPSVGGAMSEGQDYETWLKSQIGEKCPKCGSFNRFGKATMKVLNPSNPTIYQCLKCGHKWNPDNEVSTITKVGSKSILGDKNWRELYESKGKTPKDKLKNLVLEVLDEMGDENREGREVQIGKMILSYAQLLKKYLKGEEGSGKFASVNAIEELSKELVDIHEKKVSMAKQQSLKRNIQYKRGLPVDGMHEVAPPGWEKTVKGMKKHKEIDNPWALAWSMKNKGAHPHK